MWSVKLINKALHPIGAQLNRYPSWDIVRRLKLLNHFKINKILDVGASTGSYAMRMKNLDYNGTIISFEPLSEAYQALKKNTGKYKNWFAMNFALGEKNKESLIHISNNSDSSSLLDILPEHIKSEPNSKVVKHEKIQVKTLDSVFSTLYEERDNIFLKIDTQGYEKQVLDGAQKSLDKIMGIQIEMSLVPLYEGTMLFPEMREYLYSKGYELYSIENGFSDRKTGRLLQVDGIFFRSQD